MSPARITLLIVLIVAIALFVLFAIRNGDSVLSPEIPTHRIGAGDANLQLPTPESMELSQLSEHSIECLPMSEIGRNPDAYLIDEWYKSWGAPPSFNIELSSRPYAHYSQTDLEGLTKSSDLEAAHELGRTLLWSAFRGGERIPDYETLWEIGSDRFPYDSRIDLGALDRGRDILYKAAVEGHIYALIEISLSYAHEAAVHRQNGTLDDERGLEMQINAFAFGEAVEVIVVGMPESFFQVVVPEEHSVSASKRMSDLVEQFVQDRTTAGFHSGTLPTVEGEMLDRLNLCLK